MSTSDTWIIVSSLEDGYLDYTLGDGTNGGYDMSSGNTLMMTLEDESGPAAINDGDTVVLNIVNIGSYDTASKYIKKITKAIDVVLFVGNGNYGDKFTLTNNNYILTFSIRQQTDTNIPSGIMINISENSKLEIIDIERFKLSALNISKCSECESIKITNAGSANIYIGGENNGEFVLDNFTSLADLTIMGYTAKTISLSSSTTNETFKSLNLTGSTCESVNLPFETFTNIEGIIFTNCDKLDKFNDGKQYEFIAEGIESLETVNLTGTLFTIIKVARSSNIKNIFIPLPVTYVDIYDLSYISNFNMSDYKKLEYLEISNTGITTLEGVYEPDENINMEIYATHEAFKSLTLKNRKIKAMGFSTIGFSELICTSCSFKDNILDLSNYTKLTNIGLNNCGLTAFTPNSTVVYLNISSNSLTGFTINGESTTDITTLTSLQSLNIDNTGITSLKGEYKSEVKSEISVQATHEGFTSLTLQNRNIKIIDFNTDKFSTIDFESCSFENNTLDLSKYNGLTNVTLVSCGLTTFTPNTSVVSLDVSNNNSLTGFTINSHSTTNISSLTQLKSLNILGTSITSLEISNPEAERRSISSLTLSELTSELTLRSIKYYTNFSVPDTLKKLNLTNCNIEKVLSDEHSKEFSLYVDGGDFKSFDITNFGNIRNLQVGNGNPFNFIDGKVAVAYIGGDKWNNTEVFDIAVGEFSGLQIDLSKNNNVISRFNVTSGNLTSLSIKGWNPNQNNSYINFSTDNLVALSMTNSLVSEPPVQFEKMSALRDLDISGSQFTSLNFEYEKSNNTLTKIIAESCLSLESILLKNTDALSIVNLNGCESFTGFNNKTGVSNLPTSITELYLSNTSVNSIELNSTYTTLSKLTPPESVETISIPGIKSLSGFYINNELTDNITSLTSLQTINVSNTGITSLVGEYKLKAEEINMKIYATHNSFTSLTLQNRNIAEMDFSTTGFSTIECNSCSFINNISDLNNKLDLSKYTKLTKVTLIESSLTEFNIPTSVTTLNLNSCPNLSGQYNIVSSLTDCSINNCGFTSITSDGVKDNLKLIALSKCTSINIANAESSNIFIGGKNNGEFALDGFSSLNSLTISVFNITSISISSNDTNEKLETLDLNRSTCQTISFPFDKFTKIKTLNFSDCKQLKKFNNDLEENFIAAEIESLETVDLTNTAFTIIDVHQSSNITEIYIPPSVTKVDMYDLSNISSFDMNNYEQLQYLEISKTGITSLVGEYESKAEEINMEIYATHNSFKSLTLLNRNIKVMEFSKTGFSSIDCHLCSFPEGCDLSGYTGLEDVSLTSSTLNEFKPNSSVVNLNVSGSQLNVFYFGNSSTTDISRLTQLKSLDISGTQITSLTYKGTSESPKILEKLSLPNGLTSLNLAYCESLQSTITPLKMTSLKTFKIPNCNQTSSITFNSESLDEVDLSNNAIPSVKLSGNIVSLNLENTWVSDEFIDSSNPPYYGTNASKLTTLKLANSNIGKISIPYKEGVMGKITTLSLPSSCEEVNISNQTTIQDKSDPDNIKYLSAILGSCEKLNTLIADNCNLSETLVIPSPLSTISLVDNSDLLTFDLSQYNALTSFNLSGTSIANININSSETITNAAMPTSTQTITFTKAKFAESLQTRTFKNASNLTSLSLINTNITELTCDSCSKLNSIKLGLIDTQTREITGNTSLTNLKINNCSTLSTLSVDKLPVLQNLELVDCKIFDGNDLFESDLGPILPNLQTLKLENTRIQSLTITNVESFETLTGSLKGTDENKKEIGLINLDLAGCSVFKGVTNKDGELISFSSSTPYLENLNVSKCSSLTNLDISNCAKLAQLNAQESGISSISTWTNEETKQEALTEINMSSTQIYEINLNNYTNLQTIYLSSNAKLEKLEILNLENLSELTLDSNKLTTFSIDGCKNLINNYLQNLTITDSATFKNLGSFVPDGISNITPSSLTITETDWESFELNGELLTNSANSITIKLNNNLKSLSFESKPDSPTYKNLDISYNINLTSINETEDILEICDLLNANLIGFKETDRYNDLNINLVMNAFTAAETTDLPQYLGIWPQITDRYQTGDTLLGEINFIAPDAGKEVTGEFIGLHEDTIDVKNLLQYSFNNITVWDVGKYKASDNINELSFGNILSLYVADVDGNVPEDPINISVNGEDKELFDIIRTMFENGKKPEIIYTNSKRLKTLAENKGIPVQILHTSTENWNSGYPYPNVFKIYFIMDNL